MTREWHHAALYGGRTELDVVVGRRGGQSSLGVSPRKRIVSSIQQVLDRAPELRCPADFSGLGGFQAWAMRDHIILAFPLILLAHEVERVIERRNRGLDARFRLAALQLQPIDFALHFVQAARPSASRTMRAAS